MFDSGFTESFGLTEFLTEWSKFNLENLINPVNPDSDSSGSWKYCGLENSWGDLESPREYGM